MPHVPVVRVPRSAAALVAAVGALCGLVRAAEPDRRAEVKAITIEATPLRGERISPMIYGEFIEFINDMIPGMWADKLQDRSFAGFADAGAVYRPAHRYPIFGWRAFRSGLGAYGAPLAGEVAFDRDPERPFVGRQSARITLSGPRNCVGGILQPGIAVQAGQRLDFQAWLRAKDLQGPVRVLLGREYGAFFEVYASLELPAVEADWTRYAGTLVSPVTDANACFALALSTPGTLWAGRVSLMPADNVEGWRTDVVATVKASRPGVIRFGGSSLIYYHWETGIGPRQLRAPFVNQPWHNTEEHDVGIAEFLRFCQLVGAEPLICVNSNAESPASIAHEVEYCNGAATTPYGARRAADGYPRPFGVKYWQIGNEQAGRDYEDRVVAFSQAIKTADATAYVLVSYPSERLINELGASFDAICPHYYTPDVAACAADLDHLRGVIAASKVNPRLKVGVTEWNHTGGDWGDQRAWLLTLYNGLHVARMLNLYQRHSDLVLMANRSNLCNSECSGSIQTSPTDLYCTPAHLAQGLYANECGDVPLRVRTGEAESLDVMATRDERRGRVCVTLVNMAAETQVRRLELAGFDLAAQPAEVTTLAGPLLSAVNDFAAKDRVRPVKSELDPGALAQLVLPPFSLTVVTAALR
jgi:hypothetical protein